MTTKMLKKILRKLLRIHLRHRIPKIQPLVAEVVHEIATEIAAVVGDEVAVMMNVVKISNSQKLLNLHPLAQISVKNLTKKKLLHEVEEANVAVAVGVDETDAVLNDHLRTIVMIDQLDRNVPKGLLAQNAQLDLLDMSAKIDRIGQSKIMTRSRSFVKKTKRPNSSYLNSSITSSEQWAS
jgi:hypothetical protein